MTIGHGAPGGRALPEMLMMKAVIFRDHGGIEKLEYADVPEPKISAEEVSVRVRGCALNHLDIWVRQGLGIPIDMPHIGGSDIAGEVAAVGANVKNLKPGQRVIVSPGVTDGAIDEWTTSGWDSMSPSFDIVGMRRQGGYAEFAKAHHSDVLPVSDKLSFEEWAAIPLVTLTAWHMLVTRAQLRAGETVLVHAAGSGIGAMAIQVAKLCGASLVITTVGSDEKAAKALALGADVVINYRKQDFAEEVLKLTNKRGVNVIFEHIGPETWPKNLSCLARLGRMVTCGATSGPQATMEIRGLYVRQHTIMGCYMGGRKELLEVLRLVEAGKLRPVVDRMFPLKEATAAQQYMLDRKNFGKIVLKV
ncbi:MAG: zinc-binding dehydrogenase [Verrucomicrobiia bacterium]|jgi:NADPH:quinone reductase-like Zn-dependent oxidoreductase